MEITDDSGVISLVLPLATGTLTVQIRLDGARLEPKHLAKVRHYLELMEQDLLPAGIPQDAAC